MDLNEALASLQNQIQTKQDSGYYAQEFHDHSASDITSGLLSVERGGTGININPSMRVDLSSSRPDTVFKNSPKPGVTGTLDIAHGGTGATSVVEAKTNLGLATVASTGDYEDLINKPDIPSLSGYATQSWVQEQGYLTEVSWGDISSVPSTFTPTDHTHDASDIISGKLSISRIPTGITASTVALGNHTHDQYLTNTDLSSYVTDSELSSAISDITPDSIHAATEDHTHVASDITALTGYTEGTSTTTLTSTMSLNAALASLQNQIQAKVSSSSLDDYALKTEIPDISNLATKTELNDYLPLTGGTLSGMLVAPRIRVAETLFGSTNLTISGGITGSGTLTFVGGQKSVVLSQGGFTYDGHEILTEDN